MKNKFVYIKTALDCLVQIESYILDQTLNDFLNDRIEKI